MFGIGLPEILVILAVALIVVGPDKLPDLAKTLARTLAQLKQGADQLKTELNDAAKPQELLDELQPNLEEAAKTLQESLKTLPTPNLQQELRQLAEETMQHATQPLSPPSGEKKQEQAEETIATEKQE